MTLGCYEKTIEVLKLVAEEAKENKAEARQLVCSLFQAFSSVTRNCPITRQDFENRVNHRDLLDKITTVTVPTEEILQQALNMVGLCVCVGGEGGYGCVLGSEPELSPTLTIFHLPPTSPTNPPSCDWGPGICWGANSRPFLMKQQWSRWDLGAHTICCEERSVLLQVPSPAPGALFARLTVPA